MIQCFLGVIHILLVDGFQRILGMFLVLNPNGALDASLRSECLKFENITHFSLARVKSTFNRRSPPSRFTGPKL